MKSERKSFSLVEILAAVAIVGILAAIGFGTYSYAMNSARESASKALLQRIAAAFDAAKVKEGYYPTTGGSFVPIAVTIGSDGTVNTISINGAALSPEFQKEFVRVVEWDSFAKTVKNGTAEDAWGGTIYYCYPGKINLLGFDLIAPGADGKFGTAAAATPPDSLSSYRDDDGEPLSDDLANF